PIAKRANGANWARPALDPEQLAAGPFWLRRLLACPSSGPWNPFVEQLLDCEGNYIRLGHVHGLDQVR
ncbi:MAG TPA: hypothetical protein VKI17_14750, partial [Gemmataceae bacterium]|nr:hypothetical protein [Gemmataceae bacterium]